MLPTFFVAEGCAGRGEFANFLLVAAQFYGSFLVLLDDIGFSFLK